MCGIAGYVGPSLDESILKAMGRALAHRGPDEAAYRILGACGLAHTRLRVIDLSPAAAQPMCNEDGSLWIVFNGEIYNFHSLARELRALGHCFKSRSDTEVILHGYESWGLDIFRRLRGMFALALWDERKLELVLARDRIGKKPLYYANDSGRFIFGSELPAFKCAGHMDLRLSQSGFSQYLEYGYVQSPGSILDGVKRLPAGHLAIWRTGQFRTEPFSALLPVSPKPPCRHGDAVEAAAGLLEVLQDAVACRLESDVPLGCFLSGGIDSSLVASLASEKMSGTLQTYTVGFENSKMNEAPYAAQVAAHLGTHHHELVITENTLLSEFEQILGAAPEPIGDDSFVPTYLICRETRKEATVVISGDGGDELFGGYPKYRQYLTARRLQHLPIPWKMLSQLPLGDSGKKVCDAVATADSKELARWLSTLWKRQELPLISRQYSSVVADLFDRCWGARSDFPPLERWMLTDMETYLEGDILSKVDRASMAVGLEVRSPLLDQHFVEQVLTWSSHADPVGGGKNILKMLLARYVPEALFDRSKQGFGLPVEEWFRGSLRKLLLHYTEPARISRRGLLDPDFLKSIVDQHLSGRRNFARKLYAILAFEIWADHFFGPGTPLASFNVR
jgi:asparagine synthase (glutamine-hydrolysing)